MCPVGFNPVQNAAMTGNNDALRALLRSKASPDEVSRDNRRRPISLAAMNDHVSTAQLLLDARAEVNPGNPESDHSPLRVAILCSGSEILSGLLAAKANASIDGGATKCQPLVVAATGRKWDAVMSLLAAKASAPNDGEAPFYHVLIAAAEDGRLAAIDALVKAKADVNPACSVLQTSGYYEVCQLGPASAAAKAGRVKALKLLVQLKADPLNGANEYAVIESQNLGALRSLLRKNPALATTHMVSFSHLSNECSRSVTIIYPVHLAAKKNWLLGVSALLCAKADLESGIQPALSTAVDQGNAEIAKLLLESKANCDSTYALRTAVSLKHNNVVELLLGYASPKSITEALSHAAAKGNLDGLRLLADAKGDINNLSYGGALHAAISRRNNPCLDELLNRKASVDYRMPFQSASARSITHLANTESESPLEAAMRLGNVEAVRKIVLAELEQAKAKQ